MWTLNPHTFNRWVAHCMPLVILGALGFASWVFGHLICVEYVLLSKKQKGTATALIAIYAFLLVLLFTSYFRVVWAINFNPGLVPCRLGGENVEAEKGTSSIPGVVVGREKDLHNAGSGEQLHMDSQSMRGRRWPSLRGRRADGAGDDIQLEDGQQLRAVPYATTVTPSPRLNPRAPSPHLADTASLSPLPPPQTHGNPDPWAAIRERSPNGVLEMPPPLRGQPAQSEYSMSRPQSLAQWMLPKNLHEFYDMEAFICEGDGLPKWCFHCNCWKPDRSHHCGELGRCIRKMDHFCPWVGGVVGETSFKFFYQTVCYGVLYCTFLVVTTAVMVHDRGTRGLSIPSVWLVLIVLASFFGLFSAGMSGTTTKFIIRNTTTIDNISAASKVYQIAIYDPYAPPVPVAVNSRDSAYTSATADDGSSTLQRQHSQLPQSNSPAKRITFPDADPALANLGAPRRTFAIAKTQPGENPWQLETRMENFKEVMGESIWEWLFPITDSPCTKRINRRKDLEAGKVDNDGMYRFNSKLLERLRQECGISMRNR